MEDNKNDTEFEEDTLREKAEELKNSGNEAYRKKEFSKAISFYTEGIKTQCKDIVLVSQLYNNRSTVYFYLGNFPDCLSDVNDAIALQPSYLKAIIRGANACLKLKQSEEAIIWCDKGLAVSFLCPVSRLSFFSFGIFERTGLHVDNERCDDCETASQASVLSCCHIAEVHKSAGNKAFAKHDFCQAIYFYTEGIKVNCRDEKLNAKLYHNRATGNFYSGRVFLFF
ncbi:unnamed protein product [Porites lobata]|uniref:Uncharacterized protein n=1 Tax=Porites lobata TaxID=104759 RepID=A0ABN8RUJ5_9CNID|nr:unnamed protein product [Porites lobata]